ncbi:MAG: hypothetical protein K2G31_02375 [Clostridia bacterium]|nr:hypothetical protein [Clostridia bacterium]
MNKVDKTMKIRMSFGAVKTVILAIVFAGALAVVGLDIAMLASDRLYTYSSTIPAVSLVAAVIICVAAALILFNSYYKFKDSGLRIMLGFLADGISYDSIVLLRQNIETNDLYIIVDDSKSYGEQVAIKVNVAQSKIDAFVKGLREYIPNVTVELFTQQKKKNQDGQE